MLNDTNRTLARAHDLIEADQLNEARTLLESIVAKEPNNADAWWVYAHAVEDPGRAQTALKNVLRIDPNYPGAATLLISLQDEMTMPASQPSDDFDDFELDDLIADEKTDTTDEDDDLDMDDLLLDDEDELDDIDYDDDLEDDEDSEGDVGRRQILLRLLMVAALVVVLLVVFLVIKPFGNDEENTPSDGSVAGGTTPTAEATNEASGVAQSAIDLTPEITQEAVTFPETTEVSNTPSIEPGGEYAILYDSLASLNMVEDSIAVTSTDLGQTLVASFCTEPGDPLRSTLDEAMIIIGQNSAVAAGEADAVGVRLIDCATNEVLNIIAVSSSDAEAFASGLLTSDEFRALWHPVQQ